jgi:D-serine deaminase-like pyridoxal phosphate-dependent protein
MPRLLLDKEKCLENIGRMAEKAGQNKLSFRPHFKTHQSATIGNWFRDFGVNRITVSSFEMASYFAAAGWKDILVAFPFNPESLHLLNGMPGNCRISILLDHPGALPFLEGVRRSIDFYIDIDSGYRRTGIRAEDPASIQRLLDAAQSNGRLAFRGFYCHAGHSYKAPGREQLEAIHRKATGDLQQLKQQFTHLHPRALYGDTPGCSLQEDFTGIDEITPGNFVFYDLTQHALGSCTLDQIAVALECTVTGLYPERGQVLVHGGSVHFSKESLAIGNRTIYGRLASMEAGKWHIPPAETYVTTLSQEHGILEGFGIHKSHKSRDWNLSPVTHAGLPERIRIGEKLHILPVHSCLAADLMKSYHTLGGEIITTIHS